MIECSESSLNNPENTWHSQNNQKNQLHLFWKSTSAVGFKKIRNYSKTELDLRGVWLKDRDALLRWIADYRPNDQGLWLPSPMRKISSCVLNET